MATVAPQPFDDSIGPVGWSLIVVILAFIFWKLWPQMKADNIITGNRPDNYALGDSIKKKRTRAFSDTIVLTILLSLRDIFIFLLINNRQIGHYFFFPTHPGKPYYSGLTCFFAAFVATYIEGVDTSWLRDFKFAAQAWLTTILMGTLLLFGYGLFRGLKSEDPAASLFVIARLMHEAGIIVLVATVYSTNYFSRKTWKIAQKKTYIILYTGAAWLATTIILYVLFSSGLLILLCILFAAVLAACLLFYKMTPVVYSDETAQVAESVDEVNG